MQKYKFYDNITVYPDQFKNIIKTMMDVKKSETIENTWHQWYEFGSMAAEGQLSPNFPELCKEINDIFDRVILDYINEYDYQDLLEKYKWHKEDFSINKYEADKGMTKKLAMHFHTDYQNEFTGQPGWKFGFTVTMYLNDDYNGGGVVFYSQDDDEQILYTPKAGDVVVFPSGSPDIDKHGLYLHAVRLVENNPKYFVRSFYKYWQEANQEYLDGVSQYGEEKWIQMQKEKSEQVRFNFNIDYSPKKLVD